MDESGFPLSDQGQQCVIGCCGNQVQHKQGGADHENVTALVTICADGTALEPTIIFKEMNFMNKWGIIMLQMLCMSDYDHSGLSD